MSSTESAPPRSGWERAKLIFKVVEVRLRFVAVLVIFGLAIGYREAIHQRWERWTQGPAPAIIAEAPVEYFCPMHPSVVRAGLEANGEVPRCPICGMPLSPRQKGSGAALPEGRVQLSPERIALAGIKTEAVRRLPLEQEVVAAGSVQWDESRLFRIVARVSGYLEKLHVDKSWVLVKEGEPLAEIYSPELYTAMREAVLASRADPKGEMARAARERIHLLGIDEREIDEAIASGQSRSRFTIRAPQGGHVLQREVVRGSYVTVGTTLFEVADLSKVWIEADVFERDVPALAEGAAAEAWVEAFPNRVFKGALSLVHPHVEAATRTNTVRFTVDNPKHELRPGMFATVRVRQPLAALEPFRSLASVGSGVLAVPERSVIDTGSKKVVYREGAAGVFDAVRIEVGPRIGELYPVLSGLKEGDRVAAAGAFLIDAETRLNPSAAAAFTGATGPAPKPVDTERWQELAPEDRKLAQQQRTCPISGDALGSMGTPQKVVVNGRTFFICCGGCKAELEQREKSK